MNENCKNFLKSVYGKSDFQYVFSQIPEQKDKEFSILEYLEEKNYISRLIKDKEFSILEYLEEKNYISRLILTTGFYSGKLTANGIDYVANGCVDYTDNPSIKGNNNIIITNTNSNDNSININSPVTNNNIQTFDIPKEYQELIDELLNSLNFRENPSKDNLNKIENFVATVTSGTLSGIASKTLVSFISLLISKMG